MKAVVVYGPGDIRYQELPTPPLGPREVRVEVKASGVCSSDVPRALEGKAYFYPIVLGHEIAGRIVEVGKEAKGVRIGDRVAVAPLLPCWHCEWCARGRYSLCDDYSYLGSRTDGGYAEFVSVPPENLVGLAPAVDYEAGACLEPVAVVLHGLVKAGITPGDDVAVVGLGTLGLLAVQLSRILGAGRVFAVDLVAARLQVAEGFGAEGCLEDGQGISVGMIRDRTGGRGVDLVVEAAGSAVAQVRCLDMARKGGRILYLGLPGREARFPQASFQRLVREELRIYGSWNSYSAPFPGYEWRAALHYMATGQLKVKSLITHRFTFSQAKEAFAMMESGEEFFIKVIFTPCAREGEK